MEALHIMTADMLVTDLWPEVLPSGQAALQLPDYGGKAALAHVFGTVTNSNDFNDDSKAPEYMRKLFLGGLNPATTAQDVKKALQARVQAKDILSVDILRDAHGKSRCFGFVLLSTVGVLDGLLKSGAANELWIGGRAVDRKRANPPPGMKAARNSKSGSEAESGDRSKPEPRRLFVGGVPRSCSSADLTALFSPFGHVRSSELVGEGHDDARGGHRGFGYVVFGHGNAAQRALQAAGSPEGGKRLQLAGQNLTVNVAKSQDGNANSGGRRGGSSGRHGGRRGSSARSSERGAHRDHHDSAAPGGRPAAATAAGHGYGGYQHGGEGRGPAHRYGGRGASHDRYGAPLESHQHAYATAPAPAPAYGSGYGRKDGYSYGGTPPSRALAGAAPYGGGNAHSQSFGYGESRPSYAPPSGHGESRPSYAPPSGHGPGPGPDRFSAPGTRYHGGSGPSSSSSSSSGGGYRGGGGGGPHYYGPPPHTSPPAYSHPSSGHERGGAVPGGDSGYGGGGGYGGGYRAGGGYAPMQGGGGYAPPPAAGPSGYAGGSGGPASGPPYGTQPSGAPQGPPPSYSYPQGSYGPPPVPAYQAHGSSYQPRPATGSGHPQYGGPPSQAGAGYYAPYGSGYYGWGQGR